MDIKAKLEAHFIKKIENERSNSWSFDHLQKLDLVKKLKIGARVDCNSYASIKYLQLKICIYKILEESLI